MDINDLQELYAGKQKYIRELDPATLDHKRLLIETIEWKIPNLMQVIPATFQPNTVAEIGCFAGHVIGNLLINGIKDFERFGFDINEKALQSGKNSYPNVVFSNQDIFQSEFKYDLVILCDIVEHIEEDLEFLKKCQSISHKILLNLPLEKSLATINRKYGYSDPSGHLRAYSYRNAAKLIDNAGYQIKKQLIACAATSPLTVKQRELLKAHSKYNDSVASSAKKLVKDLSKHIPHLSKTIYGSNLFAFLEPINSN